MSVLEKSKELMLAEDKKRQAVAIKNVKSSHQVLTDFFSVQHKAVEVGGFDPIAEYLNGIIEATGTFGIAQDLINGLADLTDMLQKGLDETKPLFGQIPKEKIAKSEVIRAAVVAHWLKNIIDEATK